jgi:signal transduction histidine kinase
MRQRPAVDAAMAVVAMQSSFIVLTGGLESPASMVLLPAVALSSAALPPRESRRIVVVVSMLVWSLYALSFYEPSRLAELARGSTTWLFFDALVLQVIVVGVWRLVSMQATQLVTSAQAQAQEARAHERELVAMTASIAHDMRNPLTAIHTMTSVLRSQSEPDPEALALISTQCDRLRDAIDDVLVVFRPLDAVAEHDVPVGPLLQDVVVACRLQAREVGVGLVVHPSDATVRGDRRKLDRLVTNLVVNAIEASPPGTEITVRARRSGLGVDLEVVDQGGGIDPEILPHLYRAGTTTKSTGQGLGLFGARRIAREHGGSLTHTSTARGTVARVCLSEASP